MRKKEIKKVVRQGYAKIAKQDSTCSCCGGADLAQDISRNIGYTDKELKEVPDGANLGLGCGNPIALASLKEGEIVLDLGSGAGFDCFLAANRVGKSGKVIGLDMTPEMIEKARGNAKKSNYKNVEFKLGEIENMPVEDNSVDAVISNCVINLSPDKSRVFAEAFRVLKPGGRMMVSDIVLARELPTEIRSSIEAYVGCLAGAVMKEKYIQTIKEAGFKDIKIMGESYFPIECMANDPTAKAIVKSMDISDKRAKELANSVISIKIQGVKQN
ncbi:MAG: arsenite methyltransferase [Thermoplasmata archaeon]